MASGRRELSYPSLFTWDTLLSCNAALHERLTGKNSQIPALGEMGRATRWLRSLLGGKKDTRDHPAVQERREKKRWSFGKSGRDSGGGSGAQIRATTAEEAAWLSSVYSASEKEQNKHAIAVAAATAAAADAAVAAAQAAVAVVRLTSQGRCAMFGVHERLAAVKIQTVFRGFLAKKALRALKALVKLQALVRGYLVRKKAAATLYSMQALIRAQATVRAQKSRSLDRRFQPEIRPRRSLERFDDTRSEHIASYHSRRLSSSLETSNNGFDRSPKIVEMDTYRPKSRSSRRTTSPSALDSPDDLPPVSISSPLPCQIPSRITIPDCRNFQNYDWCDKCQFSSTAQSTPRYLSRTLATPAKSVGTLDRAFRKFINCPNYMSNTQSFEAKVRSQSAPKQRPEPGSSPRKRVPLSEMLLESRTSLSGVGRVQASFNFKSAIVGRIDQSLELGRETDREYYLQRKW